MLVESNCILIVAEMFVTYTIITEKSLWRLTFQSAMLNVCIFYFAVSFFGLRR